MNIQQFSMSALADLMIDDPGEDNKPDPIMEDSAEDYNSDYDDSGQYEEDFEHESHIVSMSKADISMITPHADGDRVSPREGINVADDSNVHFLDDSGINKSEDGDDPLEIFRQRSQSDREPSLIMASPLNVASNSPVATPENFKRANQYNDDFEQNHSERKTSETFPRQKSAKPEGKGFSTTGLHRGKVKTPFSRVGVISSENIPGHPEQVRKIGSENQTLPRPTRSPVADSGVGVLYGLSDADIHAMRVARSILERIEAKQEKDETFSDTVARRAVHIPNRSLGLLRRENDRPPRPGKVDEECPIPTLDDSACSSNDSRRVYPPTTNAFEDDIIDDDSMMQPKRQSTGERAVSQGSVHNRLNHPAQANLHPVNRETLRLGTSYPQLSQLADNTYSQFLSDIIESSRSRAGAATSVEELTMHRVLSDFVCKTFSDPEFVSSLRKDMVSAATDVSLSYR